VAIIFFFGGQKLGEGFRPYGFGANMTCRPSALNSWVPLEKTHEFGVWGGAIVDFGRPFVICFAHIFFHP